MEFFFFFIDYYTLRQNLKFLVWKFWANLNFRAKNKIFLIISVFMTTIKFTNWEMLYMLFFGQKVVLCNSVSPSDILALPKPLCAKKVNGTQTRM